METTGSRLAYGGLGEAKKHIEDLQKAGGGAIFIDEAYQLAQKHNPGGDQGEQYWEDSIHHRWLQPRDGELFRAQSGFAESITLSAAIRGLQGL